MPTPASLSLRAAKLQAGWHVAGYAARVRRWLASVREGALTGPRTAPRPLISRLALLAAVVLAAPASFAQQGGPANAPGTAPDGNRVPQPAGDLRVMVWNVQRGSNNFDEGPEKALAWIRATRPDVVLLQESYDIEGDRPMLGAWLAEQLGWNQHQGSSPHLCVLTPLEIEATFAHAPWHGVGAGLLDSEGRELVVWSCWLDWRAYTPYALRDNPNATNEDLLLNETERSGRYEQARALLARLRELGHLPPAPGGPPAQDNTGAEPDAGAEAAEAPPAAGGLAVPLIVGGDWNCPSHLDWTTDAELVFRHRRELALPVSIALEQSGLQDLFRVAHPCPIAAPGITWSPLYRGTPEQPGTADRIDRAYLRNPADGPGLRAVGAFTLPLVLEDASIPQAQREFPSDHAAVVIDLRWDPPR